MKTLLNAYLTNSDQMTYASSPMEYEIRQGNKYIALVRVLWNDDDSFRFGLLDSVLDDSTFRHLVKDFKFYLDTLGNQSDIVFETDSV